MHKTLLSIVFIGLIAGGTTLAAKHSVDESNNPRADMKFEKEADAPAEPLTLWYRKPATRWETQALPVGNGRLGAMVFGGVNQERLQLNEETVWDGVPTEL